MPRSTSSVGDSLHSSVSSGPPVGPAISVAGRLSSSCTFVGPADSLAFWLRCGSANRSNRPQAPWILPKAEAANAQTASRAHLSRDVSHPMLMPSCKSGIRLKGGLAKFETCAEKQKCLQTHQAGMNLCDPVHTCQSENGLP